jgi:hypothetical protein
MNLKEWQEFRSKVYEAFESGFLFSDLEPLQALEVVDQAHLLADKLRKAAESVEVEAEQLRFKLETWIDDNLDEVEADELIEDEPINDPSHYAAPLFELPEAN